MTEYSAEALQNIFIESAALLSGHFLLSSGLHSDRYLQSALVLADPAKAQVLGQALAKKFLGQASLVVSPALGGIIIGHETARALKLRAYFTERENGIMALRRGFKLGAGQSVVVVEDVITTGRSTGEVIGLLRSLGATVAAALCLVDRSVEALELGVPMESLLKLPLAAFSAEACPLCRRGLPLVKPGSRTQKHADL